MSSEFLEDFKSEKLLEGSGILEQIGQLKKGLTYTSDGTLVSYEDLYARLAKEVDGLPTLRLELDVAPGTESKYSIQLVMAMEQITDACDRVLRKVVLFESRLRDAMGKLNRLHGEFGAWYALAAAKFLKDSELKLSSSQVRSLADSEFSRLTGSLDISVGSMVSVISTLEAEIREHKKTQMDKYAMGKDQVNASWTSHMPIFNSGGDIIKERPDSLISEPEEEVEEEDMPSFVSHETTEELKGTFFKTGDARPAKPVTDEEEGYADKHT